MLSVAILLGAMICFMLITAGALAYAAQKLGSRRGLLRYGVLAMLLIFVISVVLTAINAVIAPQSMPSLVVSAVILLAVQWTLIYAVLWRIFALPVGRSFALLGVLLICLLIQLVLAVGVVRPFMVEAFSMPTGSMSPTVVPGDRILANKILAPRRWDLVCYHDYGDSGSQVYCKRLIGLPGERLRFEGGNLYVNDVRVSAPSVLAGKIHARPPRTTGKYYDDEPIQLGSDEFFLIGDNVDVSIDSRLRGPSKRSALIGVVDVLYWPLRRVRILR